tara:strand:+ start:560 stop:856 length:297 start_codon:yes stop_codon:yes gene_type:complete
MNLHKAIRAIHNSAVLIYGDTESNIIAKDINGNEIDINWTQVNAWTDTEQYKIDRQAEFNTKSIQDQLDMQYHDAVDGTTTWVDWVKSVKDNNPKPTE